MVKIKGIHYRNDYNMPEFEKTFNNLEEFENHIKQYGKMDLKLPWIENEKINVPNSFSAAMSYKIADGGMRDNTYEYVMMITVDSAIIFSSGRYTDGKAHVGERAKELFERLRIWKAEEYNFAD